MRTFHDPLCGTRRIVRAYAAPPILRPLQVSRNAFICCKSRIVFFFFIIAVSSLLFLILLVFLIRYLLHVNLRVSLLCLWTRCLLISTGSTPAQLEEAEVGRRHAPGRTAEKKAAVSARRFRTEVMRVLNGLKVSHQTVSYHLKLMNASQISPASDLALSFSSSSR